jgi:hypothetical protein
MLPMPPPRARERHRVGHILTLPPQGRRSDVLVAHSQGRSNGDEDIASPNPFQKGAVSSCACLKAA